MLKQVSNSFNPSSSDLLVSTEEASSDTGDNSSSSRSSNPSSSNTSSSEEDASDTGNNSSSSRRPAISIDRLGYDVFGNQSNKRQPWFGEAKTSPRQHTNNLTGENTVDQPEFDYTQCIILWIETLFSCFRRR